MFKSASSYLWGSSSTSSKQEEKPNNNNNNEFDINSNTKSMHYQSTASLPDLDELNLEENDFGNRTSPKSASIYQIPYHQNTNNSTSSLFKTPPIEIILDKESKFKLSATSSISFLFNKSDIHNTTNLNLSRYPYFIASNRNARYINKTDHLSKTGTDDINISNSNVDIAKQTDINTLTNICNETDELKIDKTKQDSSTSTSSSSSSSSSTSMINVNDLNTYLDSLNLTNDEKIGILTLCEWVKTEKLSIKLCEEMWMTEIIITYFSSLSPTNPDLYGCWKKWIIYRADHNLYNVSCKKLKQFFDTGIFSIGFDNKRRPVWFINTEFYDDSFGQDIITKACVLWVSSLLWNLNKNEFDLFALRRGLSVYVNLSHWSINMASWSILQSVKKAMVAYPFHLVDIYVSNIPTFMYLLKQLAAKIVVPHAMEKFIILTDTNDYFEKYAPKHKTPICAGGTLKVSATQWIKDRGFLDYVENQTKHSKSPSAPSLPTIPITTASFN